MNANCGKITGIMERTKRAPIVVDGVTFESFRTGINRYSLISSDKRIDVSRNYNKTTYYAYVDRKMIGDRYRSELAALKAAVKYKS